MDWRMDDRGLLCRVSPFGHLRVIGYLLLTAAFRSLSRPSSALSAKASSLRPYQLNLYSLPTVETVPDSHHHLYSVTNDGLLLSRIC